MDLRSEGLLTVDSRHQTWKNQPNLGRRQMIQIDALPDDVLLGIFDFYVDMNPSYLGRTGVGEWRFLVQVCRRWRSLVFRSPRRLKLQLYCTPKTLAKYTLDIWPALPIVIEGYMTLSSDIDNIIMENSRVCQVNLWHVAGWQLDNVLAAMQVPFPELTLMRLSSNGETMPVIPDSFLGGSAPRLRSLNLSGIPFPGLPKLLLSATHLTYLNLSDIPHSGYISPKAMVAPLSALSNLNILVLQFLSPQSYPGWESRSLPPQKRSILPALNRLFFKGITEYLEELVTCIDTPQLDFMHSTFFNQIDFDCPRLAQFINGTPKLTRALDMALVYFNVSTAGIVLRHGSDIDNLDITISCRESDWQLSSIEQICNTSLPPLSTVEHLYIQHRNSKLVWMKDAIETTLWLQLLRPFTAVKNLYLFKEFAPCIAASLQHAGGGITEVLPSLQNIFVQGLRPSGSFQDSIGQFVEARQLSVPPIAISLWDIDFAIDFAI